MTKLVGLTGGMGSGKSTVAKMFSDLGVSVYFADEAGRKMLEDVATINVLKDYFGEEILVNNKVQRDVLANIVFNDSEKLKFLNSVIHPKVRDDFQEYVQLHEHEDFVIKESAILFESGADADCDHIITVSAPETIRIQRIQKRDGISVDAIQSRLSKQWSDIQREAKANFVIENKDFVKTNVQVENIHAILSKL